MMEDTPKSPLEWAIDEIDDAINYWRKDYITTFELVLVLMSNGTLALSLLEEEEGILDTVEDDTTEDD